MQIEDAIEHAARHSDEQDNYNDAAEAAEAALEHGFLALCKAGSAASLDAFAASHTYLDYTRGPSTVDLIQIILDSARGENVAQKAQELIARMAKTYAHHNTDLTKLEY